MYSHTDVQGSIYVIVPFVSLWVSEIGLSTRFSVKRDTPLSQSFRNS